MICPSGARGEGLNPNPFFCVFIGENGQLDALIEGLGH
jgi:hypothetical protein